MAAITHNITISISGAARFDPMIATQFDTNSHILKIQLLKDFMAYTPLSGDVFYFRATKPDGKMILAQVECSSEGVITYTLTAQATTTVGYVNCEIAIVNGSEQILSQPFLIKVRKAASNDNAIASSDEMTAAMEALEKIQDIQDAALSAAEAKAAAQTATDAKTAAVNAKDTAEAAATAALEAASRVSELEPTIEAAETTISNLQDKITQGDIIVAQVKGYSESAEAAADQAEFYAQQAQEAASGDMLKATYDTNADGIVDDSEKLGGQLPSYYAVSTHTHSNATTSKSGFMSSSDKTKLNNIGTSGTFSFASGSWSVSGSTATQTVTVSGITSTQAYIFDIVPTTADEVKAYGYIGKIESVSGGFRATCYDTTKYPTVNLTIQYRRIA